MLPAEVGGHEVIFVQSFQLIAIACLAGVADEVAEGVPSDWDISLISAASADYAVDYPDQSELSAIRFPGHQPALARDAVIGPMFQSLSAAQGTVEEVAGKSVVVYETPAAYEYMTGEVLFLLFDSNKGRAQQMLAALP
jgi:hypothetical protein